MIPNLDGGETVLAQAENLPGIDELEVVIGGGHGPQQLSCIIDENWQVLMRGSQGCSSRAFPLGFYSNGSDEPLHAPIFAAERTWGKGHIAAFPGSAPLWIASGLLPRYDQGQGPRGEELALPAAAIQNGDVTLDFSCGAGGTGTFSLLAELWLLEAGAPRLTAAEVATRFDSPAHGVAFQPENRIWRRGVIDARSGRCSPVQLAQTARAEKLDFMAFTEPLDTLSPQSFQHLAATCAGTEKTARQLIPGVELTATEAGTACPDRPQRNRPISAWFAGPIRHLPQKEELRRPHELFWKFFGGEYAGGTRTVANLKQPVTGPQPRYAEPLRTEEDIRRAARTRRVERPVPQGEPAWPFLYAACVSTGPEFRRFLFSSDLTRDGEPGNGDVFRRLWTLASLSVENRTPIVEASLYDGTRLLRRFYPNRTTVDIQEPVLIDRQESLYWVVRDAAGGQATTGSYSFIDERMRGNMCADNQNSICSVSRAPETFVRDERELYLQHSYWHTGEAQGQLGVMRDARHLTPRVIETGIVQLCKYVQPMPLVTFSDGSTENHLNSRMAIAAASGEGNRIRYEFQMPGASFRSSADLTAFRPATNGDERRHVGAGRINAARGA